MPFLRSSFGLPSVFLRSSFGLPSLLLRSSYALPYRLPVGSPQPRSSLPPGMLYPCLLFDTSSIVLRFLSKNYHAISLPESRLLPACTLLGHTDDTDEVLRRNRRNLMSAISAISAGPSAAGKKICGYNFDENGKLCVSLQSHSPRGRMWYRARDFCPPPGVRRTSRLKKINIQALNYLRNAAFFEKKFCLGTDQIPAGCKKV